MTFVLVFPNVYRMRKLLLLVLVLAQLCVQAASKPKRLVRVTDHIAMGISENDLLALLSETVEVEAKTDVDFTDLCTYEYYRQQLKDVLRYDAATQRYLASPVVTKMYAVENTAPLWPNRQRMVFIFYKEYGSSAPFALFAIHAVHKVEVGDMNSIFDKRLPGAIANRSSTKPLILNTTYYLKNGEKVPAKMALWELSTTREMLFVPDNGPLIFSEFTYVDELGLKAWREASLHYIDALKSAKKVSKL